MDAGRVHSMRALVLSLIAGEGDCGYLPITQEELSILRGRRGGIRAGFKVSNTSVATTALFGLPASLVGPIRRAASGR